MAEKKIHTEKIYDFFYILFKRKLLAFSIFITTFFGILFGTYLVTPLWKATAKVRVQFSPKQQLAVFEGITTPATVVQSVNPANDATQILMSRELAEEIAKKFERDKLWQKRKEAPEDRRERILWFIDPFRNLVKIGILPPEPVNYLAMAVEELMKDLEEIELEEDTTIVSVSIWGESPELATAMTNTLVQLILEKNLEASRAPINETIRLTQIQLAEAEHNLKIVQESLRKYKEESRLVLYDEEARILLRRLDQYKIDLKNLESQLLSLKTERKADQLKIKSHEEQIDQYRSNFIPEIEQELAVLSLREVEYAQLLQELEVHEDLYVKLKEKLLDLGLLRNSSLGDLELKVIDSAKVYSDVHPDWPKLVLTIPLGFIFSLIFGLLFIFFIEYWNNSYKSVKELEEGTKLPVLGAVPKLHSFEKKRLLLALIRTGVEQAEVSLPVRQVKISRIGSMSRYSIIADEIVLKSNTSEGGVFLITSPGQSEGKTTLSLLLGAMFALRGKRVLVFEGDLRNPNLNRLLKSYVPSIKQRRSIGRKGLLDHLFSDTELQDSILRLGNVDIIFAGNPPSRHIDQFGVLTSEKLRQLIQHLKTKYNYIFIDSPFIKRYRDPLSLSTLSDGVIMVVEANKTPRRAIIMSGEKIDNVKGKIVGIILNKQINYVPRIIQNFIDSI